MMKKKKLPNNNNMKHIIKKHFLFLNDTEKVLKR